MDHSSNLENRDGLERYLSLPSAVRDLSLAQLSLREFQELNQGIPLDYSGRYFARYGTKYPTVPMMTFASDQDQYLFCAAWFHREVGYRSHLFLSVDVCLKAAIHQKDRILARYFRERAKDCSYETLRLAIESGVVSILGIFRDDLSIIQKYDTGYIMASKITSRGVFDYLQNILHFPELYLSAGRYLPLEELPHPDTFQKRRFFIQGLLLSDHSRKMQRAREELMILLEQKEYEEKKYLIPKFMLLCQLNCLNTFSKYWPSFRGWTIRASTYYCCLIFSGAIDCLNYILKEDSSYFVCAVVDGFVLEDVFSYIIRDPSKVPTILTLIESHLPQYQNSKYYNSFAATIGDLKLKGRKLEVDAYQILLEDKQWEILASSVGKDGSIWRIPLRPDNFEALMKANVLLPKTLRGIDLLYQQWEIFISHLIQTGAFSEARGFYESPPTAYLAMIFQKHIGSGQLIVNQSIALPITENSFHQAVLDNNLEYVELALQSKFFSAPKEFSVKPHEIDFKMVKLLEKHQILILVRQSPNRKVIYASGEEQ